MLKCVVYSHEALDNAEGAEKKMVDNPYHEHRQKLLQTQVDHSYKDAMEYGDIDHIYDYISVREWSQATKPSSVSKEVGHIVSKTCVHLSCVLTCYSPHPSLLPSPLTTHLPLTLTSSLATHLTPHYSPHPSLHTYPSHSPHPSLLTSSLTTHLIPRYSPHPSHSPHLSLLTSPLTLTSSLTTHLIPHYSPHPSPLISPLTTHPPLTTTSPLTTHLIPHYTPNPSLLT